MQTKYTILTICTLGHLAAREMNKQAPLLKPLKVGRYTLRNRVVMAPLTRRRATDDHVPTDLMRIHYRQRASAGLIIAEATNISPQGTGYINSPGIYSQEQVEAWKLVTDAVHEEGGLMFLQLWHVGRVSHPSLQPGGQLPVSSSAIAAEGNINTPNGHQDMVAPRALEVSDIKEVVGDYRKACLKAMEAGFDGVEIHGANGYLPDQFLHESSNTRTDQYGGCFENRSRFLFEIVESCCDAIGKDRVGLRLSPSGSNKDMFDSDVISLFEYVITRLNDYDMAYLHIMEPYAPLEPAEKFKHYLKEVTPYFRKFYKGNLITNVGFEYDTANKIIKDGYADLVAFGRLFISNPDLVARFATGTPLNIWDENTFYYGTEKGYIDYPSMNE